MSEVYRQSPRTLAEWLLSDGVLASIGSRLGEDEPKVGPRMRRAAEWMRSHDRGSWPDCIRGNDESKVEPRLPPLSSTPAGRQKAGLSVAKFALGMVEDEHPLDSPPKQRVVDAIVAESTATGVDHRLAMSASEVRQLLSVLNSVLANLTSSMELSDDVLISAAKLILLAAIYRFGYDPGKSYQSAAKDIRDALDLQGLSLDDETIRRRLKWASNLLR